MKFIIARSNLLKSLSHVQNIVERRNTIPVLSNVRIESLGDGVSFKATDLDTEISEIVDAKILEKGATTAPAHMLYDIVRKLSDGAEVEFTYPDDQGQLTITSGRSKFSISCIRAEDFPVISSDKLPTNFFMGREELKDVIDRTQFSISTEETRYYLGGLYLHAKNEGSLKVLRIVATDGHRLACVESPLPQGAEDMAGIIIPRKTVAEIRKLLDDATCKDVKIGVSENKIRFTLDDIALTSKLIDASYPDYERVIPTGNDKHLETKVSEFSKAVDLVSVVAEKTRAIKIFVAENHLTITTSSPDLGSAKQELDATYSADSLEIGYNFRYLLEILGQIKGETVQMSFSDAMSPAVIHDLSDSSAIYVLMPMRV